MTDTFKLIGSFATIWFGTWLLLFLLFWRAYPLVRKLLFKWHPATSSSLMLVLLSLPFFSSLLSTILLFSPYLENNVFSDHVHTASCREHFPFLNSFWLIGAVLTITTATLINIFIRFAANLKHSKNLNSQLSALGKKHGHWHLLPHQEKLVFTLGWLKNTIFITDGLLQQCSSKDIEIILEHEKEHARRHDNIRLLLGKLLVLVLPFSLGRKYLEDLHLFTEAACDFSTAKNHGHISVAETLLRIQRLVPGKFHFLNEPMLCAFTGSEVESRIKFLLKNDAPIKVLKGQALLYMLVLFAVSFALVDPLHHSVEWLLVMN